MGATHLILLGAALLGLPDAGTGGPLFVPEGRSVEVAVPPASAEAAPPATSSPGGAEAAPPSERLPLGAPAHAAAPEPREPGRLWRALDPRSSELVRVGGALAIVLVLLGLMRGALRAGGRMQGGRPGGVLEVLGRYPVARSQSLLLLKMGARLVLVHQTRNGMTTISEVSDPAEVAALLARVESANRGSPGTFNGLLRRLSRRPAGEPFPLMAPAPGTGTGGERVVVDLTRRRRRATA